MASSFQLQGLDAAMEKIRSVSNEVAQRGARLAGTRAMRVVRNAARARAQALDDPSTPSNIAKNIVERYDRKASQRERAVVVKVGVMGGAKPRKGDKDSGHWRLLEFGTSEMAARPFMRPALSERTEEVAAVFVEHLEPQIDKAIAKVRR